MGYRGILPFMPKPRPFIIEVKTDNSGTSGSNQFTIPTTGGGYGYTVRTTNGVTTGNTGNVTITWPTAGTYEVEIYGNFPRIWFSFSGDILKILKIKQWGTIKWTSMESSFYGCSNLDVTATDSPDLSNCTNLSFMFGSCTSLVNTNGSIGNWNTSSVTNMSSTFQQCSSFNQPIGNWNTSNVTNMSSMFYLAYLFDQNIGAWDVSKVTGFSSMFSGQTFFPFTQTNFNNGSNDSIKNWVIKPTGTSTSMNRMFAVSKFNQPINTNGSGWNTTSVNDMGSMFERATSFNQDIGNWNTSNVTNFISMFKSASVFNKDIGAWNVSNVANFDNMFSSATQFNNGNSDSIKNWVIKNTGTVSLASMFESTNFNQPINTTGSSWNTSKVNNMANMFKGASQFNQDIGNWDTSSVVNMDGMFQGASIFNQDIGNWNTSEVLYMSTMFNGASSFNQNIGNWNVSKVITFASMFSNATQFNNGNSDSIKNWVIKNTGTVSMAGMFQLAQFFNQPINTNGGAWDTSRVNDMTSMFANAIVFNQDISGWNVSNVTSMNSMFSFASQFNKNLGSWQLRLTGITLNQIFRFSGMSTDNYTDTIVGWANYVQTNSGTPANVAMGTQNSRIFQNSRPGAPGFLTAGAARTYLTSATPGGAGWSITDTVIP